MEQLCRDGLSATCGRVLLAPPCMVWWVSVWHGSVITLPCHTLAQHTMHGDRRNLLSEGELHECMV